MPPRRLHSYRQGRVMPILRYFLVMGPVLLSLLLLADAKLPPPGPMPNSTNFSGLNLVLHGPPPVAHLAVRSAPAPDMTSAAVLAAEPANQPAAGPNDNVNANPKHVVKSEPRKKKRKHVARRRDPNDAFAQANPQANPWAWRPTNRSQFW